MKTEAFLESLSNLPHTDYMLSLRARNPAYFLKRAEWLLKEIPALSAFLSKTKIIHITGTSGKGTTGAILQSILAEAGHTVGFYNSPHVSEVYERIRLARMDGKKNKIATTAISADTFENIVSGMKPILEKAILQSPFGLPSYFDILFVIGLCYFNEMRCDWTIIEVGCGGRYDSTNILPRSDLAVITSIGNDHAHLIGPRLVDIAYEKAGIIKQRGVVLTGPSISGQVLSVIKQEAEKKKAALYCVPPSEKGYPGENPAIARYAAKLLGVEEKFINRGIAHYVTLPGRFEIISEHPAIILDGAHNRDKVEYLMRALNAEPLWIRSRKKFLIFAATGTKDWRAMLSTLLPHFDKIYLTRHTVPERKVADMKAMRRYIEKCSGIPLMYLDPDDALLQAIKAARANDIIVATGSLYLLGQLKRAFRN